MASKSDLMVIADGSIQVNVGLYFTLNHYGSKSVKWLEKPIL